VDEDHQRHRRRSLHARGPLRQARKGLLYAGTERGMYVSFDDGASWQSLQLNLPIVPITDLAVRDDDLIAATQGRAFWILDDLSPLQQLGSASRPRASLHAARGVAHERLHAGEAAAGRGQESAAGNRRQLLDRPGREGRDESEAGLPESRRLGDSRARRRSETARAEGCGAGSEEAAQKRAARGAGEESRGVKSEGAEAEEKDPKVEKEKEKNKLPDSKPASIASPGTCAIPRRRSSRD
jgi:hypothetical protein